MGKLLCVESKNGQKCDPAKPQPGHCPVQLPMELCWASRMAQGRGEPTKRERRDLPVLLKHTECCGSREIIISIPGCPPPAQRNGSRSQVQACVLKWAGKRKRRAPKQLHSEEMPSLERNWDKQRRAPPSHSHCGSNSENSLWNWV